MDRQVLIPHGDKKIMVELTVKEALALGSGVRFNQDRKLLSGAQAKVRRTLEHKLMQDTAKLPYHALDL